MSMKIHSAGSARANREAQAAAQALLHTQRAETEAMVPAGMEHRDMIVEQNVAGGALQALLAAVDHGDGGDTFAVRMGALTMAAGSILGQTTHCEACLLREAAKLSGQIIKLALQAQAMRDQARAEGDAALADVQPAGCA